MSRIIKELVLRVLQERAPDFIEEGLQDGNIVYDYPQSEKNKFDSALRSIGLPFRIQDHAWGSMANDRSKNSQSILSPNWVKPFILTPDMMKDSFQRFKDNKESVKSFIDWNKSDEKRVYLYDNDKEWAFLMAKDRETAKPTMISFQPYKLESLNTGGTELIPF